MRNNLLQLRIAANDHADSEYIDALAELLSENGAIDEVWLATNYGLCSLDEIKKNIPDMRRTAEVLRRRGLIASMQISRTIGHAPTAMKTLSTKGIENIKYDFVRYLSGEISGGRLCHNGEDFRAYIKSAMREWGRAEVDTAWVDDDVRLWTFTNSFCFCDTCINKFNSLYGYSFDFEGFREAFLTGDELLRNRYLDFQVKTLGEFAKIISEGIHESSPKTVMALQQGGTLPLAAASMNACLDAMLEVTGENPPVRVGGGFYDDHAPEKMLDKALKSNFMVSRLPEYVKLRTVEIENLPFVSYGKSVECSALEASLYIAYGCNAASVTQMNRHEPLSYHKMILDKLKQYKPYLASAVEHNQGTVTGGICTYQPRNPHLATRGEHPESVWYETVIWEGVKLMRLGLPVNAEPFGEVYFLSAKACDMIRDEDIDFLIDKPVILDGVALAKLSALGYGERIGATAELVDKKFDLLTCEVPTQHPIAMGLPQTPYNDSYYYCKDKQYVISGERIEPVLGCYSKPDREYLGVAAAVATTERGAKWFIKGRALTSPVIPMSRRNMLVNAINYISYNPLAAYVSSYGQIVCVPRVDSEGRVVSVTVLNISISDCEDVEISVALPVTEKCKLIDPYQPTKEIKLEKRGDHFVANVGALAPWRLKTLLIG